METGSIKVEITCLNHDQYDKPKSGTPSTLWNPKSGLKKDIEVLYTFKCILSENSDKESTKFKEYINHDQHAKLKSGTSSILQSPN